MNNSISGRGFRNIDFMVMERSRCAAAPGATVGKENKIDAAIYIL